MTRIEAEVLAKAWLRDHAVEYASNKCMRPLCRDGVELLVTTHSSFEEFPRFICPLIERELPFEVRQVRVDCLRIYAPIEFQQEYERMLAESDAGPWWGWNKRRFLAIKAMFPPIEGVPFNDYYPVGEKRRRSRAELAVSGRRRRAEIAARKLRAKDRSVKLKMGWPDE